MIKDWLETVAPVDNSVASVTRAGEEGKSHYIKGVVGSFSGEGLSEKLLEIVEDGIVIWRAYVANSRHVQFTRAVVISRGSDVTLRLEASGTAGTLGTVTLQGYTQ